jgi:hypothetical protein
MNTSINVINNNNKKLPYDFNPLIYKQLNDDLKNLSFKELVYHYINHGYYENRIYKYYNINNNGNYISNGLDIFNNSYKKQDLKIINNNIEIFLYYIKKYKNILLLCTDYPSYGGSSTNCYNLAKIFRKYNHNIYIIYISNNNKRESEFYKIINNNEIKNELINLNFEPDLIILKNVINYNIKTIKKYKTIPIYFLIPGLYNDNLNKYYYMLDNKENDIFINKHILNQINICDYSFCNSAHVQEILKNLYNIDTLLFYSTFITFYNQEPLIDLNFDKRYYNYGLIVSNFDRPIKNIDNCINFLKNKDQVILIGKNSKKYLNYNFECLELLDNKELIKYYKNIKNIIQSSFFESCSNVYIESIFYGCNYIKLDNIYT